MQATTENPATLRYTKSHEWVETQADNIIQVGITQHAAEQLGDIVFVDLPEVGTNISAGEEMAVVESVKTAADIYAPVTGTIVAINDGLEQSPENVNTAPFAEGWLVKIKIAEASSLDNLLTASDYTAQIDED